MPPVLCRIGATWPERNSGFAFRDFIKSKHAGVAIIVYYTSNHSASGDRDTWVGDWPGPPAGVLAVLPSAPSAPSFIPEHTRLTALHMLQMGAAHTQWTGGGQRRDRDQPGEGATVCCWHMPRCRGQRVGTYTARVAAIP